MGLGSPILTIEMSLAYNNLFDMRETTRQLRHYHHRTVAALVMASGAGIVMIVAYVFGVV